MHVYMHPAFKVLNLFLVQYIICLWNNVPLLTSYTTFFVTRKPGSAFVYMYLCCVTEIKVLL